MANWTFRRDTSFRKQFFVPDSFAHPAKMDAQLLIKIVEEYTQVGETILDPMAGSGTTMLACTLGRNCVLVELEEKFCKMMRDNWEEVRMRPQLGYQMGDCQIIQGDARQLGGLVDKIVTSPPFASTDPTGADFEYRRRGKDDRGKSLTQGEYAPSKGNIGNLPYGQIDKIVTSPPYTNRMDGGNRGDDAGMRPYTDEPRDTWFTQRNPNNLGNLPYGNIDSIITSPPYENQVHESIGGIQAREDSGAASARGFKKPGCLMPEGYTKSADNIGNLKSDTYLQAMLQVYQQCYKVLKPAGLMILVTKNFIRNKQVVRLDTDTVKLCEQAGFTYLERHYRKLPAQSFWRIIALLKCDHRKGSKQKPKCELGLQCPIKVKEYAGYLLGLEPEKREESIEVVEKLCPSFINSSPRIDYEDILVFRR